MTDTFVRSEISESHVRLKQKFPFALSLISLMTILEILKTSVICFLMHSLVVEGVNFLYDKNSSSPAFKTQDTQATDPSVCFQQI